ncbi:isocitrate lyase/PEP mutase family protein [Pseudonocardia alni]|uniref:isocitrate lyase/PEP mutase family protein n=1 Tax=Pseudonocardia alni TaxID=33907 RepID=UPI00331F4B1F
MSTSLRTLLDGPGLVVAPGAADSITARLVQAAGFDAVYMTGFGATASRLGAPDIGLLTQTEMAEHARNMTRAVSIPVIADADTGYGGPSNIERTLLEYAQAGVAALHLEDQVAPKRCGQMAGIRLLDAEENAARLRGAVDARERIDPAGPLVIGRTDALPAAGVDEALRRATLYRDAGVDLVFVDGVKTVAEVEAIAAGVEGPKVLSLVDGTDAARLTAVEVEQLGFSVLFHAVTALFTATRAVADALASLRATGAAGAGPAPHTYADFTELVDLDHHRDLDDRFGA